MFLSLFFELMRVIVTGVVQHQINLALRVFGPQQGQELD